MRKKLLVEEEKDDESEWDEIWGILYNTDVKILEFFMNTFSFFL